MKTDFIIEFQENKVFEKNLVAKAKEIWLGQNNLLKNLHNLEIYYKPEEGKCYYVFNEKVTGFFQV